MRDGDRGNGPFVAAAIPALVALQTTPTGEVGPDELVDYWPFLVRAAWFFAGFLLAVLVGWYLVEPVLARIVRRRNRNNPTLNEAITRYIRASVLVVAVFVGAGVAGYGDFLSDSALVVAAATLAIGVAGQEVIGSIVSGLTLVTDPEFNVGNYIEWSEGEGTVHSITLRVTRVVTPDGELVTIPNTTLTSEPIIRPYGRGRYRVVEEIGLAYEDDLDDATAELENAASAVDGILAEPPPRVFVEEFGDDAVVLRAYYWIEDPDRAEIHRVRSAYARAVKSRLEDAGFTISPPSEHDLQGRIGIDESG